MNIKYPRTEIMVVLGSKVYPLYVTEPAENWTVKKSAIKSFLNLPEPKVNIDYGYNSDEF